MQPPLEQSFLGPASVERSTLSEIASTSANERGFSIRASLLHPPLPALQLKLVFVIERIDDQPQLFRISSDAQSDRLRLFLRLGRCLLWLLRCWRWTLFKDNLSFPGNVRADDLLSKLLQIEFDIGDSLFQGFAFVWHMFVPI